MLNFGTVKQNIRPAKSQKRNDKHPNSSVSRSANGLSSPAFARLRDEIETLSAMLSGPILPWNCRLGLSIRLDRHRYLPHSRPRTPPFGTVNGTSSSFPDANRLNADNFLGSITTEKGIDNAGQSSKFGRQKHVSAHLDTAFRASTGRRRSNERHKEARCRHPVHHMRHS